MFKIFLRKRFVCGQGVENYWDGVFSSCFVSWKASFNTIEEAYQWCVYSNFRPILFDRKTKVEVEANKITKYFNNLKEKNE